MVQTKKDDTVVGVIAIGYVICAIIFSIWNWDYIDDGLGPVILWGHIIGGGIIAYVCGTVAKSYEIKFDDLISEINLDFEGKLDRANFWIIFLGLFLFVDVFLVALDTLIFGWTPSYDYSDWLSYSMIATYFTLLSTLAIGTRRLHDTGRSGWWQLLYITIIGIAVLIIFWAQDSREGDKSESESFNPDHFAKEIERLSDLKNKGAITEEEYKKAKSKILI